VERAKDFATSAMKKSGHHSKDFALSPFAAAWRAHEEECNIAVHTGGCYVLTDTSGLASRFRSNTLIENRSTSGSFSSTATLQSNCSEGKSFFRSGKLQRLDGSSPPVHLR